MGVRIWLAALDDLDLSRAAHLLGEDELERGRRMRSDLLARRFLARRLMARSLLAGAVGADPAGLTLETDCERCGRPHPASPIQARSQSVWWSASSSGGTGALALSAARIGLDLEGGAQRPRWPRIVHRFFTEPEGRALAEAPDRFLAFWTMKEAYLKALGVGLAGGLDSLDCTTLTEPVDGWSAAPRHPGWRFARLDPGPGLTASVAVRGAPDSIELRRWEPQPEDGR
jgi:4'-phosphopantetheinyl transferase